jgi:archaellum biogenesis ATPase FlaH
MTLYSAHYVWQCLAGQQPEPPDRAQAGNAYEALLALHDAVPAGVGKVEAVWQTIQRDQPDLAASIGLANRWRITPDHKLYNLPPPQYLIEGELVEGSLHVLFGASGIGKSFVALDYALTIAEQGHDVIYCAGEGQSGYADRVMAWRKHHGKPDGKPIYFTSELVPLLDAEAIDEFILEVQISRLKPKLIIIDTLAWCLVGGDENSARDMGEAVRNCRHIQETLGTAILLVHHTGKSSTSERGSSALRGASDMMIYLEDRGGTLALSCDKAKDTEPFPTRFLRLVTVEAREGRTSCVVMPAEKVVQTKDDKLTRQQVELLELLNEAIFIETGAKYSQIEKQCPKMNTYRVLSQLKRLGYVRQGEKGDPYTITSEGIAALAQSGSLQPTQPTSSGESTPHKANGKPPHQTSFVPPERARYD